MAAFILTTKVLFQRQCLIISLVIECIRIHLMYLVHVHLSNEYLIIHFWPSYAEAKRKKYAQKIRTNTFTCQVILCYFDGVGEWVANWREKTARANERTKENEGGIHKHILKGAEYGLSGYCGLQYDVRESERERERFSPMFYRSKMWSALLEKWKRQQQQQLSSISMVAHAILCFKRAYTNAFPMRRRRRRTRRQSLCMPFYVDYSKMKLRWPLATVATAQAAMASNREDSHTTRIRCYLDSPT